ncbi:hypothetical protein [Bacillus weihaiensis]|uniref:hypothetical protein n=1 Tax=Bacillus weihaiensis TaxID=1547283 RepID=UPI002353001B|nr:hypothetical protein [Bacillus weihaiensis]
MPTLSQRKKVEQQSKAQEKLEGCSINYLNALNQMEESFFKLMESLFTFQKSINAEDWKVNQVTQVQLISINRLRLLVTFQDQLLKKFESICRSETIHETKYISYPQFKINKARILYSYRLLFTKPSELIIIRKLLDELENYSQKKKILTNKGIFSPVQTKPWINSKIKRI